MADFPVKTHLLLRDNEAKYWLKEGYYELYFIKKLISLIFRIEFAENSILLMIIICDSQRSNVVAMFPVFTSAKCNILGKLSSFSHNENFAFRFLR